MLVTTLLNGERFARVYPATPSLINILTFSIRTKIPAVDFPILVPKREDMLFLRLIYTMNEFAITSINGFITIHYRQNITICLNRRRKQHSFRTFMYLY